MALESRGAAIRGRRQSLKKDTETSLGSLNKYWDGKVGEPQESNGENITR